MSHPPGRSDTQLSSAPLVRTPAQDGLDVLLVGPYPPPLGGVSSHVRQVADAAAAAGYRVGVLDHFGNGPTKPPVLASLRRNPLRYLGELARHRADVVHVHYAGRTSVLLAAALARRRWPRDRWLLTIHNHSLTPLLRSHGVRGRLVTWALSQFDELIAVSDDVRSGIARQIPRARVSTLPAYVGVGGVNTQSSRPDLLSFLEAPGVTMIVAAYRVRTVRGGGDIYGIDVASVAFTGLAEEFPDLRLVIFLAHPPRGWMAKRYLRRIHTQAEREWPGRSRVVVGEPLVPAFDERTIYLRPTRTDGDAVSVREALARGVPVIASDATSRPPGVRVVALVDTEDWVRQTRRAILAPAPRSARATLPADASAAGGEGSLPALLTLYRRHLGRAGHAAPTGVSRG